jgi:hypothetical protein
MTAYIIRRLMQSAAVVLAMSVIVFLGLHVVGDPVYLLIDPQADQQEIERTIQRLGLDQPIYIQYFHFIKGAATGDLGTSFVHGTSALKLIVDRMPATLDRGELDAALLWLESGRRRSVVMCVYRFLRVYPPWTLCQQLRWQLRWHRASGEGRPWARISAGSPVRGLPLGYQTAESCRRGPLAGGFDQPGPFRRQSSTPTACCPSGSIARCGVGLVG